MKRLSGDLLDLIESGDFEVLIHGCNCFCNMGAGFAFYLKSKYPEVLRADKSTILGDREKLGSYTHTLIKTEKNKEKIIIVNAYTQYNWKGEGVLVEYEALRNVFSQIKNDFKGKKIIYPKIGAGLAKGDWRKIKKIIRKELEGEEHYFVEYKKRASR